MPETDTTDPFGDIVYSSGVTLDLTGTEEELAAQFAELLWREGRLAQANLRCALKDGGQDCRTCPEATLDPTEARSRLCRLGKDQCTVEALFNERRDARLASITELAEEVDAAVELIPDDLAELATSVRT